MHPVLAVARRWSGCECEPAVPSSAQVASRRNECAGLAVLATPLCLESLYPPENRDLARRILKSGAVVSEHPLGSVLFKAAFLRRNRIISGLSSGVLAIQAGLRSGTLSTVAFAQRQNRPVYCPRLCDEESCREKNAGIKALLASGQAREIVLGQYGNMIDELKAQRDFLLARNGPTLNGIIPQTG